MCEISNGIIICSHGSINPRQAHHEWVPARLKQIEEEEKQAVPLPAPPKTETPK